MSTLYALMKEGEPPATVLGADRFHHAATLSGTVSREHINMTTPEAGRAVVGEAIARHRGAALQTGKVLPSSVKPG